MSTRPTLLNSCARAATAAEARFRIDTAPAAPRATRVVALDADAWVLVRGLAERPWRAARFLRYDPAGGGTGTGGVAGDGAGEDGLADVVLSRIDGDRVRLSEELAGADFVMMVATEDSGAPAASAIGGACTLRGVMTAGVVVGSGGRTAAAVSALRPHARVLLVSDDRQDASEVLSAVGA